MPQLNRRERHASILRLRRVIYGGAEALHHHGVCRQRRPGGANQTPQRSERTDIWRLGFKVFGPEFSAWDSGFGGQGLGFRV